MTWTTEIERAPRPAPGGCTGTCPWVSAQNVSSWSVVSPRGLGRPVAYEFVAQTMDAGGDGAIRLILELLDAASDGEGTVAVGTGPLEDLLSEHGLRPETADRLARWLPDS